MTSSALALTSVIALAIAATPVLANNLTPEQLAMIKKYGITEADQRKLFGTTVSDKKPRAAMPVAAAPAPDPAPAEVAAPSFFDGTYVFGGFETHKSLGERLTNINGGTGSLTGSYGAVIGFNSGHTFGDSGFGIQAGASLGFYDFKGRLRLVPASVAEERQAYYTVGVYKHGSVSGGDGSLVDRLSLGLVWDGFEAKNWGINANSVSLSQLRGTVGYALSDATEVGVWATHGLDTDRAAVTVAGAPGLLTEIRAADQANLYVKHTFQYGGDLTAYAGVFDSGAIGEWQLGVTGKMPLSPDWAAYGSANYVVPHTASGPVGSGQEQFSLSFGLTYHFGGNSVRSGNTQLPLQDVAGSSTFLITD